jgi:type II secretory pathway pseudopilin PulG
MTTTGLILTLVICLTLISLVCLASMILMIWWQMSSAGQHSISVAKLQQSILEALQESSRQAHATAGIQATLTETLLLGREMPETSQPPMNGSQPETSMRPEEVWSQLSDPIQETLAREAEEAEVAGTWPSPSEMLHDPSADQAPAPL